MIGAPSSYSPFDSTVWFENYIHDFPSQFFEKFKETHMNCGVILPSSENARTNFLGNIPLVQQGDVMDDGRLMDAPGFTLQNGSTMTPSISAPPDPLSSKMSSPQSRLNSPPPLLASYAPSATLSKGTATTTDTSITGTTNTNTAAVAISTATSAAVVCSPSFNQCSRRRRKRWLDHSLTKHNTSPMTLKELRARRNRESAKRSRLRQKHYLNNLESKYYIVLSENHSLKQLIEQLLPPLLDCSPLLKLQIQSLFSVPADSVQ